MCNRPITIKDVHKYAHELGMHKKHPIEECDDCFIEQVANFKFVCERILVNTNYKDKLGSFHKHMVKLIKQRHWKILEMHQGYFVAQFLKLNHSSKEYFEVLHAAHPTKIGRLS